MGSVIALRERSPVVANTPVDKIALVNEVRELTTQLTVFDVLEGLRVGVDAASKMPKTGTYLLILDADKRETRVRGFAGPQEASEAYTKIEKENVSSPAI